MPFLSRFETVFLICLMAALWALMPITQLWDWDEPLYARTGIEMYAAGNLLLPRFNGEIFAHKPPLGYWMMGLSAQIFGQTEFAARFFSAPLLAISALLIGRTATLMFDTRVGEIAMVVFASSFMSIYLGAAAMMDAPLMAGYAICVWVIVKATLQRRLSAYMFLMFAAGGWLTLMVKGPVGPALIGPMAAGVALFLPKQHRLPPKTFAALALAGGISIMGFLLWFLPANAASGGALIQQGIGIHIIGRALAPMEGHGGQGIVGFLMFLPVYIPVLIISMAPWTTMLFAAIKSVFKDMDNINRTIILAWFLPTFVLFSLAATKLPHYIFPALAPLSVAVGYWLSEKSDSGAKVGRGITALIYAAFAAGMVYFSVAVAGKVTMALGVSALLFLSIALFVLTARISILKIRNWVAVGFVSMFGLYTLTLTQVDTATKLSRALGQAIKLHVPRDAVIFHAGYGEPSMMFYAQRPVSNPFQRVSLENLAQVIAASPQGFAVLKAEELQAVQEVKPELAFEVLSQKTAYNLNQNSQKQTVFLLTWGKP